MLMLDLVAEASSVLVNGGRGGLGGVALSGGEDPCRQRSTSAAS